MRRSHSTIYRKKPERMKLRSSVSALRERRLKLKKFTALNRNGPRGRSRFRKDEVFATNQGSKKFVWRRLFCLDLSGPNFSSGVAEDAASYKVRDNFADKFVQWLKSDGLLDRRDWKYDDIKGYADMSIPGCWFAHHLWRANRYQRRIE